MPTQSLFTPESVQLVGGLDFVTPRPAVAPGSLIDCYNFEVADRLGYVRSSGIERFDGRASISNVYSNLYSCQYLVVSGGDTLVPGAVISLLGKPITEYFAVITKIDAGSPNTATFTVYDFGDLFGLMQGVGAFIDDAGTVYAVSDEVQSTWASFGDTTLASMRDRLNTHYGLLQNTITQCATSNNGGPNGATAFNPALGTHWFEDQLYAVIDQNAVTFSSGNTQLYPGDILTNTGVTGYNMLVRDAKVSTGSFSTGDAVGTILFSWIKSSDGSFPYNVFKFSGNAVSSNGTTLNLIRGSTTGTSVVTVNVSTGKGLDPWYAGMYRTFNIAQIPETANQLSSNQGWKEVDLGYEFSFGAGTTSGPPNVPGRNSSPTIAEVLPSPNPANSPSAGNSFQGCGASLAVPSGVTVVNSATAGANQLAYQGTPGSPQLSLTVINNASSYTKVLGHTGVGSTTFPVALLNFNYPEIPADAIITGFVINAGASVGSIAGARYALTANLGFLDQANPGTPKTSPKIVSISNTAVDNISFGSSTDTWGIPASSLSVADLGNFIADWYITCTASGTNTSITVDYFNVTVYYETSSSIYYFNNGIDDVQGVITNSYILTGDWSTANATGLMQVTNVLPVASAARSQILSGDKIFTLPGGVGTAGQVTIATVSSNMAYAGLPSHDAIIASNSQYEIIDANFFGNKDWSALYGVSGAGQAFVYDSFYFRYIFTGISPSLDTPRHVAFDNFHLMLGYDAGAALSSAPGLPEDFSGVDGAAEFDTGDRICGFLRLNGQSLGIFCQKSVQALNGTDNTNFSLSILCPYEGAIEYTVFDSVKPIFASYRGITTLDQTDAYGNFLGHRLSSDVTPWLVPRLVGTPANVPIVNLTTRPPVASRVALFSLPIRNKNQYKLAFKDGFWLTMTLMGDQQEPTFTLQKIDFANGGLSTAQALIPLAHSAGIDSQGKDRNHISYYDSSLSLATSYTDRRCFMYEMDRGWSWDGVPIVAWFTTTHNFLDNPFQIVNAKKIRLHGQSQGFATMSVMASEDYILNNFSYGQTYGATATNAVYQDISLPINGTLNAPLTFSTDFQPETNAANIAVRGRSTAFQFVCNPTTIEPPCVAQQLLLQITSNRADA